MFYQLGGPEETKFNIDNDLLRNASIN